MRKLLLLLAVVLSIGASAQGDTFLRRHMTMGRNGVQARKMTMKNIEQQRAKAPRKSGAVLDEASEKKNDRVFRYVYAYSKDTVRTSETIYMREKTNGVWGGGGRALRRGQLRL